VHRNNPTVADSSSIELKQFGSVQLFLVQFSLAMYEFLIFLIFSLVLFNFFNIQFSFV